jgi:molybdenum cofactor cytidylyltransferase
LSGSGRGTVAGVVLAAGRSRRAGTVDKLVADIDGEAMVRRVVRVALESGLEPVVAVTPGEASGAHRALDGLVVRRVVNPRAQEGMGTSVACGIRALPRTAAAAVVLLGDMPWVSPETVRALVEASWDQGADRPCVPVRRGRRGNPVLWPRVFFPSLTELGGDEGARVLLQPEAGVCEVAVTDPGIHRDVDTAADLEALQSGATSRPGPVSS